MPLDCVVDDADDGVYAIRCLPTRSGRYVLRAWLEGVELPSPLACIVRAGGLSLTHTTLEGVALRRAPAATPAHFRIVTRDSCGNRLRQASFLHSHFSRPHSSHTHTAHFLSPFTTAMSISEFDE